MTLPQRHVDDLPDCVREAEAAIAGLTEPFLEWAGEALCEARRSLARARAEPSHGAAAARSVYDVAHNIKGQGGSFGYGLVSDIAAQLCAYIKEAPGPLAPAALDAVEAHLATIGFVLERRIRGDGGALRDRVLGELRKLAEIAGSDNEA